MLGETVGIVDVLKLTVLSMTVVFATLQTIALILELFKILFYDRENKKKDNKQDEIKKEQIIDGTTSEAVDLNKDKVLAALFTAAIAASNGKHTSNIRIKSIKKIS